MIRRKKKKERNVMRWSERADKQDKRKQSKCVKRVGTAICTVRTKSGQIHYPVVLLDTKYVCDSFDLSHRYHDTCIYITQQWGRLCHEKIRLKTLTLFNVIMNCLENFYVIFITFSSFAKQENINRSRANKWNYPEKFLSLPMVKGIG